VSLFPNSKSGNGKANTYEKEGGQWGKGQQIRNADYGDSGSASRFFMNCSYTENEINSFNSMQNQYNMSDLYSNQSLWKTMYVSIAEKLLQIIQVIKETTVI